MEGKVKRSLTHCMGVLRKKKGREQWKEKGGGLRKMCGAEGIGKGRERQELKGYH